MISIVDYLKKSQQIHHKRSISHLDNSVKITTPDYRRTPSPPQPAKKGKASEMKIRPKSGRVPDRSVSQSLLNSSALDKSRIFNDNGRVQIVSDIIRQNLKTLNDEKDRARVDLHMKKYIDAVPSRLMYQRAQEEIIELRKENEMLKEEIKKKNGLSTKEEKSFKEQVEDLKEKHREKKKLYRDQLLEKEKIVNKLISSNYMIYEENSRLQKELDEAKSIIQFLKHEKDEAFSKLNRNLSLKKEKVLRLLIEKFDSLKEGDVITKQYSILQQISAENIPEADEMHQTEDRINAIQTSKSLLKNEDEFVLVVYKFFESLGTKLYLSENLDMNRFWTFLFRHSILTIPKKIKIKEDQIDKIKESISKSLSLKEDEIILEKIAKEDVDDDKIQFRIFNKKSPYERISSEAERAMIQSVIDLTDKKLLSKTLGITIKDEPVLKYFSINKNNLQKEAFKFYNPEKISPIKEYSDGYCYYPPLGYLSYKFNKDYTHSSKEEIKSFHKVFLIPGSQSDDSKTEMKVTFSVDDDSGEDKTKKEIEGCKLYNHVLNAEAVVTKLISINYKGKVQNYQLFAICKIDPKKYSRMDCLEMSCPITSSNGMLITEEYKDIIPIRLILQKVNEEFNSDHIKKCFVCKNEAK